MQIPLNCYTLGLFNQNTDEGYKRPLTSDHFVQIDLLVLRLNDSEDSVNTLIQDKASTRDNVVK